MKLYEINEAIESLIDHETGEILDFAQFEALQLERDQKIEGIALWIKNLRADAAALKVEREALAERETAVKNKAERLADYLARMLDGGKFETARCAISYRASHPLMLDEAVFMAYALKDDADLLRIADPAPNKTAITAAIKAGKKIPGAWLVDKQNIQIK